MNGFLTELDILADVSRRLESAGIPFMLTGSLAMNFYAQPRMTRDIDLVVEAVSRRPSEIVKLFEPDYYVSEEGIADAQKQSSLFNLIHQNSIIKVDCILRKQTSYGLEAFRRRRRLEVRDFETWISTKEDLILAKLSWYAETQSERQRNDIRNLMATGFDDHYVARWVNELALAESWNAAAAG